MKKFLVIMLAMLWMSVAAFSQITISQEDYDKLPSDTRTQIEKITTEKAIKVKSRKFLSMLTLVRKQAWLLMKLLKQLKIPPSEQQTLIWDKQQ